MLWGDVISPEDALRRHESHIRHLSTYTPKTTTYSVVDIASTSKMAKQTHCNQARCQQGFVVQMCRLQPLGKLSFVWLLVKSRSWNLCTWHTHALPQVGTCVATCCCKVNKSLVLAFLHLLITWDSCLFMLSTITCCKVNKSLVLDFLQVLITWDSCFVYVVFYPTFLRLPTS